MTRLTLEMERTVDRRDPDQRIRHLEAQADALRQRIWLLERKLGERVAVEAAPAKGERG